MHGMGFISINEWDWNLKTDSLACLVLFDGTVTIMGLHADCGINVGIWFPSMRGLRTGNEI